MRLIQALLDKLQTAVENLAVDGDIPWDMTFQHPMDAWIHALSKLLVQLLEIRGTSLGGTDYCAAVNDGPCGVVARARKQSRTLRIVLVSESNHTGVKEEVRLLSFHPESRRDKVVDWITTPKGFDAYGNDPLTRM